MEDGYANGPGSIIPGTAVGDLGRGDRAGIGIRARVAIGCGISECGDIQSSVDGDCAMSPALRNISFDGSPVQLQLDSPWVVCMDPLGLDWVREELAALPADARRRLASYYQTNTDADGTRSVPATLSGDIGLVLARVNANQAVMSCYQIAGFRPGRYTIDPRDIRKFGDEESVEELDFDEEQMEPDESGVSTDPESWCFVAVDSGALVLADSAHLSRLVDSLTWEQYTLGLEDDAVFGEITRRLGEAYFAVILAGCEHGMEFDGDGTYTLKKDAVRRCD